MKIIGKNSLAYCVNILIGIAFLLFTFHLVYFTLGYIICYANLYYDVGIFPEIFETQKSKSYSTGNFDSFTINYPFAKTNFFSGVFRFNQTFIGGFIGFLFFSLFFYFLYNSISAMNKEKIFNSDAIKWLKRFSYLNILGGIIYVWLWYIKFSVINILELIIGSFFLFSFGIIVLFIVEFFKKGYELQSENDLTI